MPQRVDARDVLDANARTVRPFQATVRGHFRRTGPNSWDDYLLVRDPPETIEVGVDIPVQLEPRGIELRLRRRGKVLVVRWTPAPDEGAEVMSSAEQRQYFVARYLVADRAAPGIGAAAVIARKLNE